MHLMSARHYVPALGQFLQPDPSRLEANAYGYARNSPVSRVDPIGHESWLPTDAEWSHCWRVGPIECAAWASASALAIASTKPLQNIWTENAFRHCIWQCLLTNSLRSGTKAAKWAYVHEIGAGSTDRKVDLHNNGVGRSSGTKAWAGALSMAWQLCDRAWRDGRLLTVRNGRIEYSDGDRYPRNSNR